jgi:hypothetical protein
MIHSSDMIVVTSICHGNVCDYIKNRPGTRVAVILANAERGVKMRISRGGRRRRGREARPRKARRARPSASPGGGQRAVLIHGSGPRRSRRPNRA